MKIGVMPATTDWAMRPDEMALACEERDIESFWVGEHTHIPTSRRSPAPAGGDLPREYSHLHDPFVALAAAAAVTKRILLGTGVCLVVEHDPIVLAKQVSSLDHLSDRRFQFGIGAGWNAEEMENHGTVFATRWKLLRERIEAMKRIWTEDEPEYHGEFVDFDPIWQWPKPVQQPHPPIIMGSSTGRGRQRAVDYCDGWIPVGLRRRDLPAAIADLHARAAQAGRDPAQLPVSVFWGTPTESALHDYASLGVTRTILGVPAAGRDDVLPLLDRYAEFVRMFA